MTTTLQIVNPGDLTSVLFDFNDSTGANNPGGLKTWLAVGGALSLGAPDARVEQGASDEADGELLIEHDTIVEMDFRMAVDGTTVADLRTGFGALQRYLYRGGVIKYVPHGGAGPETRYIDFYPSPIPALLQGEDSELLFLSQAQQREGIQLTILRRAAMRGAKITSADNLLKNATCLRDSDDDGDPDLWGHNATDWGSLTISGTAEAWQLTKIATGTIYIVNQATAAGSVVEGDVVTGSIDFRMSSGTPTGDTFRASMNFRNSGGGVLQTTNGATVNPVVGRWYRLTVTGTAPANTSDVMFFLDIPTSSGTGEVIQVRNAKVEKASSATPFSVGEDTISQDPSYAGLSRIAPFWNAGDVRAPVRFTPKLLSSGVKATQMMTALNTNNGVVGRRVLATLLNKDTYWVDLSATANGWTRTLYSEATQQTRTGCWGGNAVQVTHATYYGSDELVRRVRVHRTGSMTTLRGSWHVYGIYSGGSEDGRGKVQLRWSPTTAEPCVHVEKRVAFRDAGTGRSYLYLGKIQVPEPTDVTPQGLALELWETYSVQNTNIYWDGLVLIPGEDHQPRSAMVVRDGAEDTYTPSLMTTPCYKLTADPTWTAGTTAGGPMYLNDEYDAAGIGSNAGTTYGAGHWKFKVKVGYFDDGYSGCKFKVRVVTVGGAGAGSVIASQTLTTTGTSEWTEEVVALRFDASGTDAYQVQVCFTENLTHTSVYGGVIALESFFQPVVTQNAYFLSDPESGQAWSLDTGGEFAQDVDLEGPGSFRADPGLNLVHAVLLEAPVAGAEDDQEVYDRTWTMGYSYYPRYLS